MKCPGENRRVAACKKPPERRTASSSPQLPKHLTDILERSSQGLAADQKTAVAALLTSFADVFSSNQEHIGRTGVVKHSIDTGDTSPVRQRARRLPINQRAVAESEVQKMLTRGVIEPSASPWASPVFFSYYRRFVRGFADVAKPLYKLTEKGSQFVWTEACKSAFKLLKAKLTSASVLAYPTNEVPFILDTDASNQGIGAVLSQVHQGQEEVVAYYSRSLTKEERNYCVTRKELLAVVAAVRHFHHYLYGRRFLVRSDHGALQWLLNSATPRAKRQGGWRSWRCTTSTSNTTRVPDTETLMLFPEDLAQTAGSARGRRRMNCGQLQQNPSVPRSRLGAGWTLRQHPRESSLSSGSSGCAQPNSARHSLRMTKLV